MKPITARYTRIADIRAELDAATLDLNALLEHYLNNIAQGEDLNVFLEVFADEARAQAQVVSGKIKAGNAGRLAGAIVAVKDNLCLTGHRVGASSKILAGYKSIYTATAVQRLIDEDAIIIGRTGCDEFAMGSSNENSAYGAIRNPLDVSRVPGGSSGGSAAAVAADMCIASLGSDTGGSIRQPASFCGVVGFKPSYGRISRYGLIAYASSFDQIGPFTHTLDDSKLLYEVMAGKDPHDSTTSSHPVQDTSHQEQKTYRIAYLQECMESAGLSPAVRAGMEERIAQLKAAGHTVEPVSFPYLEHMIPTYYVLTTAEASSNLARFDGIRYGYRSQEATDIESTYVKSRSEGFGEEVKRRILLGTFVLSAGYYDAYYTKAQRVRQLVKQRTEEIFADYDLILTPSAPTGAFELNSVKDPISMYLQDIFTVQANLAGIPAISVPGLSDENGMPVGMQLMAPAFAEERLFEAAAQCL